MLQPTQSIAYFHQYFHGLSLESFVFFKFLIIEGYLPSIQETKVPFSFR
jgi:hypothetical protein